MALKIVNVSRPGEYRKEVYLVGVGKIGYIWRSSSYGGRYMRSVHYYFTADYAMPLSVSKKISVLKLNGLKAGSYKGLVEKIEGAVAAALETA